jgi:hypothetical protein
VFIEETSSTNPISLSVTSVRGLSPLRLVLARKPAVFIEEISSTNPNPQSPSVTSMPEPDALTHPPSVWSIRAGRTR